jgi:hypothetical protein
MAQNFSQWLNRLSLKSGEKNDAPSRDFDLILDLPAIRPHTKSRASKKNDLKPPMVFWKDLNSHPIELLRNIERYLRRINIAQISETLRSDWIEQSLLYACPAIRKIYSEQYKVDALPESHDRREGLVAAINVCGQLTIGFKRQFLNDYNLSDSKYSKIRPRIRLNALRVLELIRIEQRLRSLRYQKLPDAVWRDCNRLFFAIAQCEDIKESHQALACLQAQLDSKARGMGRIQAATASARHIYLSIQLYGLMDTNSVFSRNLHMIDVYLLRVIDSLEITPDDGSPLLPGEVIIYSNQKRIPYFKRQSDNAVVNGRSVAESTTSEMVLALRVDLVPLETLLTEEQKKLILLFESEQGENEQAVSSQEDLARLSIVDVMCDKLRLKQRKELRENVACQKIIYVYNGFMPVYKFLVEAAYEADEIDEGLAPDHELRDALASHSAIIASGVEAGFFGQWYVVDRSDGGVHIKTQESQFTTAMFVGQIITFSYSREELKTPELGYVTRLYRGKANEIEVTIQILSKYPEPTAIQSDFLSKNEMALPAIIFKNDNTNKTQRMVLHHSHHLPPGTLIQVERENEQYECVIAYIIQTQLEFIVYGLDYVEK